MPAADAVSVMLLPVVATSVEDDAVQEVPFQHAQLQAHDLRRVRRQPDDRRP